MLAVGVIKGGEYYRKDDYKLDSSLFQLSGISRNVSPQEVGKIWRQQAKVLHPDSGGSTQLFRLAQEATKVLRDPMKRHNYDRFHVIDDSGFQSSGLIFSAWEAILSYLVWGVFILPFVGTTSFLDIRNQTTLFIFGMLFMEILNTVSRVPLTFDPLNYVLPYASLKQRHLILRDVCPFLCGLFFIYLRVFTRTWIEDYRDVVGHCYHTIARIESIGLDSAKLWKDVHGL